MWSWHLAVSGGLCVALGLFTLAVLEPHDRGHHGALAVESIVFGLALGVLSALRGV